MQASVVAQPVSASAVPPDNWFTFLSIGQTLKRTFGLFIDRLDIFLTISGLVHLPAICLTLIVVLALAPADVEEADNNMAFLQDHMRSVVIIWFLEVIFSTLVTITGEGGMVRATADIYAGRTPEWYPSFRLGTRKFLPLMGGFLLVFAAYVVVALVTKYIFIMFMWGANTPIGVLFMLLAFLAVVAGACAIVYIYVTIVPLYPIIVIEEKGPIAALHRCMELSRGRRAYFFVGVMVLMILQYVLSHLLHTIFNGGDAASFFFAPAGKIVSYVPNILYVPLVTILRTILYMSVRADKEGLNQQVLVRELSEPVEYNPPLSDYSRVALVDERQEPVLVATPSDDNFMA